MKRILPEHAQLIPQQAERVFKGKIYDVYQWEQDMYDGSKSTFEMLKRDDSVQVLAIKDSKIIILEEQQPDRGMFYGLPGGRHDSDDSIFEAAKRETLEETGMSFKNWNLVNVGQPSKKIEWFVYVFVATGFENKVEQKLDAGEKITVTERSLEDVKSLLGSSRVRFLPEELLASAATIDDLVNLPSLN